MVGAPRQSTTKRRREETLFFTNNQARNIRTITRRTNKAASSQGRTPNSSSNASKQSNYFSGNDDDDDEPDDPMLELNHTLAVDHMNDIEDIAVAAVDRSRRVNSRVVSGSIRKSKVYDYKRYLHRIMRTKLPDSTASARTMECMSNFMSDIFDRVAEEAGMQAREHGRQTLTEFDIEHATRILLPGKLAPLSISLAKQKMANLQASSTGSGTIRQN